VEEKSNWGAGFELNLATADTVLLSTSAEVNNDGILSGEGGKVVVWGNNSTSFLGTVIARGGSVDGDGGTVVTTESCSNLSTDCETGNVRICARAEGYDDGSLDCAN
jgi:hypothetical protein